MYFLQLINDILQTTAVQLLNLIQIQCRVALFKWLPVCKIKAQAISHRQQDWIKSK